MAEKIFHATIENSVVETLDPEALEFSAWILHDLGWLTQQGMLEEAMSRIEWYAELNQEAFLKACSNGLTVILNSSVSQPSYHSQNKNQQILKKL